MVVIRTSLLDKLTCSNKIPHKTKRECQNNLAGKAIHIFQYFWIMSQPSLKTFGNFFKHQSFSISSSFWVMDDTN